MTTSPSVTTPITAIGAGIFAINTLIEPSASAAHDIDWLEANHEQVKTDLAILRDLLNGNHSASAIRLPSGSWLAVITDDDMALLTAADEAREEVEDHMQGIVPDMCEGIEADGKCGCPDIVAGHGSS